MYAVIIQKRAKKFMDKLPFEDKKRIVNALEKLPDNGDIKKLKGYADYYRLRVGDYRIIYTVDNGKLLVCVVDAGNRGQIYNKY